MTHHPGIAARPLLIGGMHRSGTSLTASLFASAGLDLGSPLLGATQGNPLGHFEDLRIFEFHRRALVARGICTEGYTATARGSVPPGLEPVARDIIADRMRPGVAWGWKEPRTTLFLDFWQERLPEARHVFVFRRPWEVADSLFRRGDDTFTFNPPFALHVWTHYNRLILDFVHRHPASCLVFEISQVTADPDGVCAAVRSRLGIDLGRPEATFRPDLFIGDDSATHEAIVRAVAPEALRIYEDLRDVAGIRRTVGAVPHLDTSAGDCAVIEWARASRAEAEAREAAAREACARAEVESRLRAELAAAREACARAEVESRLRAELAAVAPAEHEARLRIEAPSAAGRASRRPRLAGLIMALRRASRGALRPIEAAVKRVLVRPLPEPPAPAPDVLPFPRPLDTAAEKRAA